MKTYAVYEKSENDRVAVKVGFCWPGCIWSLAWLLCARLWERAGFFWGSVLIIQLITVPMLSDNDTGPFGALIQLCAGVAIAWFVGSCGNEWRCTNLRARGFKHVVTLEAESKDEALAKLREISVEELEKEAEKKKTAEAIKSH